MLYHSAQDAVFLSPSWTRASEEASHQVLLGLSITSQTFVVVVVVVVVVVF